jgi:DNA-binding MarR family transcriptional regulator
MQTKAPHQARCARKLATTAEVLLKESNGELTIDQLRIFFRVAECDFEGEPTTLTDLADHLNMVQSSASRNVASLLDIEKPRKPGACLCEQYLDNMDRRRRFLRLTTKGRRLMAKLEESMG